MIDYKLYQAHKARALMLAFFELQKFLESKDISDLRNASDCDLVEILEDFYDASRDYQLMRSTLQNELGHSDFVRSEDDFEE